VFFFRDPCLCSPPNVLRAYLKSASTPTIRPHDLYLFTSPPLPRRFFQPTSRHFDPRAGTHNRGFHLLLFLAKHHPSSATLLGKGFFGCLVGRKLLRRLPLYSQLVLPRVTIYPPPRGCPYVFSFEGLALALKPRGLGFPRIDAFLCFFSHPDSLHGDPAQTFPQGQKKTNRETTKSSNCDPGSTLALSWTASPVLL